VVALHPRGAKLGPPARVRLTDTPQAQLEALLGHHVDDPAASFAQALDCPTEDAAALLRRRGDHHWVSLLG